MAENNAFRQSPYERTAERARQSTGQSSFEMPDFSEIRKDGRRQSQGQEPASGEQLLPPKDLAPVFTQAAQEHGVPVNVLMGIAHQESNYNPAAVGPQTDYGRPKGLMQYIDSTAQGERINPFDARESVNAAARQFKQRLDQGYSPEEAIMAHYAGDDREKWGEKTREYLDKVKAKSGAIGNTLRQQAQAARPDREAIQSQLDEREPGRYKVGTREELERQQAQGGPSGAQQGEQRDAGGDAQGTMGDVPVGPWGYQRGEEGSAQSEAQQQLEEAQNDLREIRQAAEQREDLTPEERDFMLSRARDRLVGARRRLAQEQEGRGEEQEEQVDPELERTWGEAIKDVGAAWGKGSGNLLQMGGSLYGLMSGDMENWGTEYGQEVTEFYEGMESDALQERQRRRNEAVEGEEGQFNKFARMISETASDPALFTSFLVEQIPNLVTTGIGGRGTAGVAGLLGAGHRGRAIAGTVGGVGTGATMQGADAGGDAYDRLTNQKDSLWAANEAYKNLVEQGVPEEEAKERISLELSRLAAIKSAAVSTGVQMAIPGARSIERVLAGVARKGQGGLRGAATGAARGFAGETAAEGTEEAYARIASNQAVQGVNPDQETFEGAGEAAGQGALFGLFGGVSGAVEGSQRRTPSAQRRRQADEQRRSQQGPMGRAAEEGTRQAQDMERQESGEQADVESQGVQVRVTTPDGDIEGTITDFADQGDGRFTAQVLADDGMLYEFTEQDGVQILRAPRQQQAEEQQAEAEQQPADTEAQADQEAPEPGSRGIARRDEDDENIIRRRDGTAFPSFEQAERARANRRLSDHLVVQIGDGEWGIRPPQVEGQEADTYQQRNRDRMERIRQAESQGDIDQILQEEQADTERDDAGLSRVEGVAASRANEIRGQRNDLELRSDGSLFSSRETAQRAIRNRRLENREPIEIDGGWAIAPIQQDTESDVSADEIDAVAADTNTEPTEAQAEAGNYRKGKLNLHGLDISIESPRGSTRSGTDRDGNQWESEMAHHYGYVRGTEGRDGDHVDVFLGPESDNPNQQVFVIDQVNPETRRFDEHKAMIGFSSEQAARDGYLANYEDGWQGIGGVTQMTLDEFRQWLDSGDTKQRLTPRNEQPQQQEETQDAGQTQGQEGRQQGREQTVQPVSSEPESETQRPAMPERVSSGLTSFEPQPIGGVLYRETDAEGVGELLQLTLANTPEQGFIGERFVADNPDLALGQGDNRGAFIELDGDYVSGRVNETPGSAVSEGDEYVTDYINRNAIRSFVLPEGANLQGSARAFASRHFNKETLDDGRTRYTRKGADENLGGTLADYAADSRVTETRDTSTVSTPAGRDIEVRYKVVDASELVTSNTDSGARNPDYPSELQPRDRSRAASEAQITEIANNLNPRLLGENPSTTDGAPIVSSDNVVESGNGRANALLRVYRRGGDKAEQYRQWLESQGYDIEGTPNPVLVRERVTPMDMDERQRFALESNERTTMEMGATERAMADARELDDIINLYRGGDVSAAANRDFVRAFVRDVVSASDRGNFMDQGGMLSPQGRRRIEAALLAKAYGDESLVTDLFESADNDIRAIGGALLDVAGVWARMRNEADEGSISSSVDVTPNLMEAVNLIRRARAEGKPVREMVNQNDMFSGALDPVTEDFMRVFYRGDSMNRARGREKVAGALRDYVERARATQPGEDMFGEPEPAGSEILRGTNERLQEQEGQGTEQSDLFAGARTDDTDTREPGRRGQRPESAPESEAAPETADGVTDPYENAETRPDTTEAQRELGRSALRDFLRQFNNRMARWRAVDPDRGQAELLGARMYRDFREGESVALTGHEVTNPADLASLAQVYRDPRFETFRILAVKDGRIISEQGVTSRLPAMVRVSGIPMANEIRRVMREQDADGYYLLHNHPSGRSTPSEADKRLTKYASDQEEGFLGHVVVDYNEYSVIDSEGQTQRFEDENLGSIDFDSSPEQPHDLLGKPVSRPNEAAEVAKHLSGDPDRVVIVTTTGGQEARVNSLMSMPSQMLQAMASTAVNNRRTEALAAFRRYMRATGSGGSTVIVALPDNADVNAYENLLTQGVVVDVVNAQGDSLAMKSEGFRGRERPIDASARSIWLPERSADDFVSEPSGPGYSADGDRNLFVAHNLSEDNLEHALGLGGLPAPSLAVGRTEYGFGNFGNITLLAPPSILESPRARTFDADVYSPRQPRAQFKIDVTALQNQVEALDNKYSLETPDPDSVRQDGVEALLRSEAYQWQYLNEIGRAPKPKRQKVAPAVRKLANMDMSRGEMQENPEAVRIAEKHYRDVLSEIQDDAVGERRERMYFDEDGSLSNSAMTALLDNVRRYRQSGGIDTFELKRDIRKRLRSDAAQRRFREWATEKFREVNQGRLLQTGRDSYGRPRYKPYNLDNLVREMTRDLRGGEGFNYGAGSVRSAYARELRNVRQVQARRDRIIDPEEMQQIKEESQQRLMDTLEALKPYYKFDASGFMYADDASSAIAEGRRGQREAFNMDEDARQIIDEFVEYLQGLPTAYFEAKVGRAVDLSEFSVAVVPRGTSQEVVKALRQKGVTVKRYDPNDPDSRRREIERQEQVRFSFAGEQSAQADPRQLESAQQRLAAGEDADTVRRDTGWFRGDDGRWRYEIDDSDAGLSDGAISDLQDAGAEGVQLGQVLNHEALFAAYPDLASVRVIMDEQGMARMGASGSYGNREIRLAPAAPESLLSTLLHEVQHGIQNIEGFAQGGNENAAMNQVVSGRVGDGISSFLTLIERYSGETVDFQPSMLEIMEPDELVDSYSRSVPRGRLSEEIGDTERETLSDYGYSFDPEMEVASVLEILADDAMSEMRDMTGLSAAEQTRRLAGETEARNVQARQRMSAEERAEAAPRETQDVAPEDVIVVFGGDEIQNAPAPANAMRAPQNPAGMTPESLQESLTSGPQGAIIRRLIDAGAVVIHERATDMPGGIEGAAAQTAADGTIHMAAENLRPRSALPTLLHEAFHEGGEALIGTEQWKRLRSQLGALYRQGYRSTGRMREFWEAARGRIETAQRQGDTMSDEQVIEEFGAYAIEEYSQAPRSVQRWVDNVVGAIKAWLRRRFGIQAGQVTPAQLRSMAISALRNNQIARRAERGPQGPQFSRAPQTDTRAFKEWFGDSQVVDESGEPLVMYHGIAGNIDAENLSVFETGNRGYDPDPSNAFYFTPDKYTAREYTAGDPDNIIAAYLKAEDPLDLRDKSRQEEVNGWLEDIDTPEGTIQIPFGKNDTVWDDVAEVFSEPNLLMNEIVDQAKEAGYDSLVMSDGNRGEVSESWAVFEPEQIKSATDNTGTFDPADPDIRRSMRPSDHFDDLNDTQKSFMNKIGPAQIRQNIGDRWRQLTDNLALRMRQAGVDRYAALLRNDRALYGDDTLENSIASSGWVLARMSHAAGGAVNGMMNSGRIYLDSEQKVIDIRENTRSLKDMFNDLGSAPEVDRFMAWVAANRAKKLEQEGRERLFTSEEIAEGIKMSRGTLEDGRSRGPLYSKAWKEFQQHRDDVLGIAEGAGIITPEQRQTWTDEFYVPFYRLMDDETVGGPGGSSGLSRQQAYQKLKGSQRRVNDLLENSLMNFHHLIQASMKNQAAVQSIDNAIELDIAEPTSENARDRKMSTFIMRNGQKEWYNISDGLTFKALSALNHPGYNNPLMKIGRAFKRLFTEMITITPQFVVANTLRDSLSAMATSPTSKVPLKSAFQGALTYGNSEARARMLASGGAFSFGHVYGDNPDEIRSSLRGNMRNARMLSDPSLIPGALLGAWRRYNSFTDFAENINRAGIWEHNIEQGKLKAAFEARDLMDFSAHGDAMIVRILTDLSPFLNARIQGIDKLYRSGFKPGAKTLIGKGTKADKRAFGRFAAVSGALSLASMLLYLRNWDDEEYRKLEDWQKDTYWFVRFGDNAFFIPKPFEVGALATMSERGLEQYMDPAVGGEKFRERVGHMLSDTFALDPIPQALRPVYELGLNEDRFTGRPIENLGMRNLSPQYRTGPGTTRMAEEASEAMSEIAGSAGFEDAALSPVQIDHLIQGYLGSVGSSGAGLVDSLWRNMQGEEQPAKKWKEYQPIRRFYKDLTEVDRYTKYGTVFYDALKKANRAYSDIQHLQEYRELKEADQVNDENVDMLSMRKALNRVQRDLSEINRDMRRIHLDDEMSGEEKRMELDRLRSLRNMITEEVGKDILEMRATADEE